MTNTTNATDPKNLGVTADEKLCVQRGMDQWRASCKRPDLDEKARVAGALQACQRQSFALEREARVSWYPPEILPPVPKGQEQYFIVAVRRGSSGKVWTFPATYLNAYPLECNVCECDAEHSEDGCPCTGWYTVSSDGEYENNYTQLLSPVDELVAWSEIQVHPLDPRAASTKGSDA